MEKGRNEYLLLATKLAMPPTYRRNIVQRQRLYTLLETGVRQPLTLITAPAGFGKTTLLAEWLRQHDLLVAWVTLEKTDNDLLRFWHYVTTALSTCHTDVQAQLALWQQAEQPLKLNIEATLTTLINSLMTLPQEMVLVLDDYHVLTTPAIDQSMTFLLEHLPPQLHLIIVSRQEPSFASIRLRAQGKLIEVRASELRFTSAEVESFLTQTMGLTLDTQDIAELSTRTEGWAAGLQLAALSLQGCNDPATTSQFIKTFSGTNRYVFHYLSEEVFNHQSAEMQQFLLTTSLLERLHASLCDAVTEEDNGQAMLEQLDQFNLFLLEIGEQEGWYRYYYLFADWLRHHLQQTYAERVPKIHLRASDWYEQHDLPADAITHALAADDIERCAELIELHALTMLDEGRELLLHTWLVRLPESAFSTRPALSYQRARHFLLSAHMEDAEQALQQAEQLWNAQQDNAMLSRVYDLRASIALLHEQGEQALAYAQQALTLAPAHNDHLRAKALINLGSGYLLLGDTVQAHATLIEGQRLSQKSQQINTMLVASSQLGMVQIAQANLRAAAQTFQQILSAASISTWQQVHAHVQLASIYHAWNDGASAVEHCEQALRLATEKEAEGLATAHRFILSARLAWQQGEHSQVMSWLDQAERSSQRFGENRNLLAEITALRVQFLLDQGDSVAAHSWLQQFDAEHSTTELLPYAREACVIMHARYDLAEGRTQTAINALEKALAGIHAQGRYNNEIALLIPLTRAYHAENATQQTLHTLKRALILAEAGGHIRVFIDEGPAMTTLLTEFCNRYQKRTGGDMQDISLEYVHRVLTAFGQELTPSWNAAPPREDMQLDALSEREHAVLHLIAEGLSNQEIAHTLVVTVSTIKTHLNNIYAKLYVHTRLQAVTRAYELGLLSRGELDTEPLSHIDSSTKV